MSNDDLRERFFRERRLLLGVVPGNPVPARDRLARMFKRKPDTNAERSAAWGRLRASQETLKTLEQEAGIREVMDSLALRETPTTDEPTRRAIFGVTDSALRRRIMQACRDCENAHVALRKADNDSARYREIIKTHARRRRSQVFVVYSLLAAFLVGIGQGIGHPWEIVGGAVGVIWAVVDMSGVEEEITRTVEEHRALLATSEKNDAEWATVKPLFSDTEIASGLRDK